MNKSSKIPTPRNRLVKTAFVRPMVAPIRATQAANNVKFNPKQDEPSTSKPVATKRQSMSVKFNKRRSLAKQQMLVSSVPANLLPKRRSTPRGNLLGKSKTIRKTTIFQRNETKKTEVLNTATQRAAAFQRKPAVPKFTTQTTMSRNQPMKTSAAGSSGVGLKRKDSDQASSPTAAKKPKIPADIKRNPQPYDFKSRYYLETEKIFYLKEKIENLTSANETTETNLKLTSADLNAAKTQLKTLSENIKAMEIDHDHLKVNYEAIKKLKEELEAQVRVITDELNLKKRDLERSLEEQRETKKRLDELLFETRDLRKVNENLLDTKTKQEQTIEELTEKLHCAEKDVYTLDVERKRLHNNLQELKGNIRVLCRVRPPLMEERDKQLAAINYVDDTTIEVDRKIASISYKSEQSKFSFDKVFPHTSSQQEIFDEIDFLVQSAVDGYNVCVFAYGTTGSGKTYTMEGQPGTVAAGVIPRTFKALFHAINEKKRRGWTYTVEASFLQIYNEHIYDMLVDVKKVGNPPSLDIRQNGDNIYVGNLHKESVSNEVQLLDLMKFAQSNRTVAATKYNAQSSRSHSISRIELIGTTDQCHEKYQGIVNLVDLAGSEKISDLGTVRASETKNINKSLLALSAVMDSLVKKDAHVQFRDSKLTHLLKPCLTGNSKTLMLANISPLETNLPETLNTLRFASSVNKCQVNARKNRVAVEPLRQIKFNQGATSV